MSEIKIKPWAWKCCQGRQQGKLGNGKKRKIYHPAVWYVFFFFNDTATTEIYTLSLHDALPIFSKCYQYDAVVDSHCSKPEDLPAACNLCVSLSSQAPKLDGS